MVDVIRERKIILIMHTTRHAGLTQRANAAVNRAHRDCARRNISLSVRVCVHAFMNEAGRSRNADVHS